MHDYFDLQLRFAELFADKLDITISESVFRHTNLFRRFGLIHLKEPQRGELWQSYTQKLESLGTFDDRLDWTMEFYQNAKPDKLPVEELGFGCFSLDLREQGSVVRVHFANLHKVDDDELSPLHPAKHKKRKAELRSIFSYLKDNNLAAQRVMGVSWLYTTKAYSSLFPSEYIATKKLRTNINRFQGSSSWGQFLDHESKVKQNLKETFLVNLEALRRNELGTNELWKVFPIPTLVLESPLDVFYDYFEV